MAAVLLGKLRTFFITSRLSATHIVLHPIDDGGGQPVECVTHFELPPEVQVGKPRAMFRSGRASQCVCRPTVNCRLR